MSLSTKNASARKPIRLKLYNTLAKKEEYFTPKKGQPAKIYTCGPTVYNFAHIGNLRTYLFEDILRRTIKLAGHNVFQVMNITDVDDKIIKASIESGKSLKEITRPFEKYFFEDIKKLNIERPEKTPRATEHIKGMIAIIQKLLDSGYAYKEKDGSIYFNIAKFKKYGRLTNPNISGQKKSERILSDEYAKEEVKDFSLWKAKKDGEHSWKSPWGLGRPGWHIECSAMAMEYLGDTLDIHAGGVDNAFPHHENEIAQSEAATGKLFSRFFIHGEHLLVNKAKMAKSAGNFYTLRDIEEKGYSPLAFRYLCLQTHYRSKMNFTWESLEGAASALQKLKQSYAIANLTAKKETPLKSLSKETKQAQSEILHAFTADLNTSKALAILWKTVKNKSLSAQEKILTMEYADKVLGLNISISPKIIEATPEYIANLAHKREQFRKEGNYAKADKIRQEIQKRGYEISDKAEKYKITKKISE